MNGSFNRLHPLFAPQMVPLKPYQAVVDPSLGLPKVPYRTPWVTLHMNGLVKAILLVGTRIQYKNTLSTVLILNMIKTKHLDKSLDLVYFIDFFWS